MDKIYYSPRRVLVKPIKRPEKINFFKHLVIFTNDGDASIETAIPDFEEKHFDSTSSNVAKIKKDTEMSFFEIVEEAETLKNVPVYEVIIYSGNGNNPTEYATPKVLSSRCINGYSVALEEILTKQKLITKVKR